MNKSSIFNIQSTLKQKGFNPGALDGLWGRATEGALTLALSTLPNVAGNPSSEPPTKSQAMIYQGSRKWPVTEIDIHCSATRPDWMEGQSPQAKRDEIDRWHRQDRGWNQIGYHWFIDRDGTIVAGRPEEVIGAHIEGNNAGRIAICLAGGYESAASDKFYQNFTLLQQKALKDKIKDIMSRTKISRIKGHNDYAPKACPGFKVNMKDWT